MKKELLLCLLTTLFYSGFAQDVPGKQDSTKVEETTTALTSSPYGGNLLPQFSPLSPNAAAIQKFGDYQVNMATGIPDISIPIFTAKSGDLSMPVILRYHASGFKVREHASWVGLGWSLDLGAYVNRNVQGMADDLTSGYLYTTITGSKNFCNNSTDYEQGHLISSNVQDAQPDIFSYTIPRQSGKYILGYAGTNIFKIPDNPVHISYVAKPNYIESFKVVDDQGIEFNFRQRETQNTEISGLSKNYTSSWLLNAVKSPGSSDSISYSYQSGGLMGHGEISWTSRFIYNATPSSGGYYTNTNSYSVPTQTAMNTSITQQNPHKIFFKNGEIEFIQSGPGSRDDQSQSRYLERIHIYNYENGIKKLIKVVKFNYGYFTYGAENARLKLNSITFTDAIEATSETYNFEYWTNTIAWPTIPTVNAMDFFGYYNGVISNTHLITTASYNGVAVYGGAANRETVTTYMKNAVLKKIIYPTKGTTEFDFETNKYKFGGVEKYGGGLRVKSIKSVTGGKSLLKRYEYASSDGTGVGLLATNWKPNDAQQPLIQNLDYTRSPFDPPSPLTSWANQATFTQDGSNTGIYSMDAAAIYYTTVNEYFEEDADPQKNGKNGYTFDFSQDVIVTAIDYAARVVKPWLRGNLLSKSVYDATNVLVSSETLSYTELATDSRLAAAFVTNPYIFDRVTGEGIPCPTTFKDAQPSIKYLPVTYHTGIKLPVQKTTVTDGVTYTENTTYLPNLLTDRKETTGSKPDEKIIEQYTYPFSAAYTSDPTATTMVSRNMLNYKLETDVTHTSGFVVTPVYKEKRVFAAFTGTNARGLSGNLLPAEIWSAADGTTLQKKVTFTDYSHAGRPLAYYLEDKMMPVSLVWGYNHALLIAELKNVSRSAAETAMSGAGIDSEETSVPEFGTLELARIRNLQNNLTNAMVTWYSHRPHVGVSGIIAADGIHTGYSYDGLLRLKTVKDNAGLITDVYRYNYATVNP